MSKIKIEQNTPRLVVEFRRAANNEEQFKWGMIGKLPALSVIGYVTRVQAELAFRKPEECEQLALIIVWDEESRVFDYCVHPDIPVDSLVGMLEMVKVKLVDARIATEMIQQQGGVGLYGADGVRLRNNGR